MTIFYFNINGNPVAFRRQPDDKYLFDTTGNWIGWFPWGNEDALDQQGNYLGTVVGNRFLARVSPIFRGYPGYPGYPGYAGYPGYPGFAGYAGYISGFTDIDLNQLKGR